MPKKINFPKEIIAQAIKQYEETGDREQTLDWIEKQVGERPTRQSLYRWIKNFQEGKLKVEDDDDCFFNEYTNSVDIEKIANFVAMQKKLNKASSNEEKETIINKTLDKITFHDPNKVYPVLLECFQHGLLLKAQEIINLTAYQRRINKDQVNENRNGKFRCSFRGT